MLLQGRNQFTRMSQLLERLKTVNPTWRSCVETFEDELLGVANQNNGPLNVRLRKMGARVAYHTITRFGKRLGRQCKHNELQVEVATSIPNSTDAGMDSVAG